MSNISRRLPSAGSRPRLVFSTIVLALSICAAPAFAGESDAQAALSRAEAKVEMVTRQSGQAGDKGDQSFNMARQRLEDARSAHKSNDYDRAEMLADESALLADLTGEKAILAGLQISHDNLLRSTSTPSLAQ